MTDAIVNAGLNSGQIAPPKHAAAPAHQGPDANETIKRAAREFEAMVLGELLKPLFESVEESGLTGSKSNEAYGSMLHQEYARAISEGPGLGIAASIERALIELQTTSQNNTLETSK